PLGLLRPHRVRRGALLGEVHHRVRAQLEQQPGEPVVLRGQVNVDEPDLAPGNLTPCLDAVADHRDRSQRVDLEVDIDLPAAEVVQNGDVMTTVRQIQRRRPATKTITAEYQDA